MTTARARAVTIAFGEALRPALLAAASGALLIGLAPAATAASCATTASNDTCIITLGDLASAQDGLAGTDRLVFDDAANSPLNVNATQFQTSGGNFLNFEEAQVANLTTLIITSGAATDAPVSLSWIVDGTLTVQGAGGNAIGNGSTMAISATGIFNVVESETIGALSGSGSIVLSASEILSADGSSATNVGGDIIGTTFSGIMSGAGGFTKVGTGMLKLTGDNSFTGPLTVSGGTLEIGNAGAIDNATSVTTSTNASLSGTVAYTINADVTNNGRIAGDVTINGNVNSNGGLQPGNTSIPPGETIGNVGQDMGTITINGDYATTGAFAYLGVFVDLDGALPADTIPSGLHDSLVINGNVSGADPTYVYMAEFDSAADTGTATTGNGIQLIRITGTNNGNEFIQGNVLTAGAYQYLLRYVANYSGGTDDGYFLQSAVRDELFAHPALLSAGQALVRHCFRDDQRIPDSPKGATYGRAWVGYHQGNVSDGADTGIDMDQDYNCTTGGMDWRMGYGWFGGVSGGFGKSTVDLTTAAGVGNLDGSARAIEAYASFTSSSLFINLSAGYTDMDWTYTSALVAAEQVSSSGFIGSAQAGVALDVDPFAVKLMGTVSYDDTSCGTSCFAFAVTEDTGLLEARGTVRIDGVTWGGSVRPWAQVSYSDVLSDGINTVSLGAVTVSSDTSGELLIFDAGLQAYLDENLALFADGGYHESLSKDVSGYKGGIGLKLYW